MSLVAEYPVTQSEFLQVTFFSPTLIRLLDHSALMTETKDAHHGLVRECFAYRVEDDPFASTQSAEWADLMEGVRHYRFVTRWCCMDVLAPVPPDFLLCSEPDRYD